MRVQRMLWIPALSFGLLLGGCTVEEEQGGEMPEVEVTEEGRLPEYDVDPAEVEVTTDTQTVVTPDVDVNQPNEGGSSSH